MREIEGSRKGIEENGMGVMFVDGPECMCRGEGFVKWIDMWVNDYWRRIISWRIWTNVKWKSVNTQWEKMIEKNFNSLIFNRH